MGKELILLTLLGVAVFFSFESQRKRLRKLLKFGRRRSDVEQEHPQPILTLPPSPSGKTFVPSKCAKCNPYEPCSTWEEYFCKNVLKKSKAKTCFQGQYWVQGTDNVYRIDFAVFTNKNQRIAVELDGYEPHVSRLDRNDFNKQLARQNQLSLQGWKMLRFSLDQARYQPKKCLAEIDALLSEPPCAELVSQQRAHPLTYIEFKYIKREQRAELESLGAKFSEFRDAWHLPFGCPTSALETLPEGVKPIIWRYCLFCSGEAVQRIRRDDGKKFWACQACERTFNDE